MAQIIFSTKTNAYLLLFLGLLFLQSLTIFLVDVKWNKTILQDTRIWDRILHSIQKSHFPFPYVHWYKGNGTCMDHFKRKKETEIEVLSTMFVNLLFNMVMLIPLGILCKISEYSTVFSWQKYLKTSYFYRSRNIGEAQPIE